MVSSVEQLMNLSQIQKLELNDIVFKLMEENYNFIKLDSFETEKMEIIFGFRFFKYLFIQDACNLFF